MKIGGLWIAALVLAGCAPVAAPPPDDRAPVAEVDPQPSEPITMPTMLIHLTVYQMSVPVRTVSQNSEFWKHVDEQALDVATYNRLLRNGFRAGLADVQDWNYFREILAQNPAVTKVTGSATLKVGNMELPLNDHVFSQRIMYIDENGELAGSVFDECENLLAVTFQAAPRKARTVRIAACPVVRALRTEMHYTDLNHEIGVEVVRPERIYDLNLRVDVPVDHFLIIAPSPDTYKYPSLPGNVFLMHDDGADRSERVLVFSPQPVRFDRPATTRSSTRGAATEAR